MDRKLNHSIRSEANNLFIQFNSVAARMRSIADPKSEWTKEEIEESVYMLRQFARDLEVNKDAFEIEAENPF